MCPSSPSDYPASIPKVLPRGTVLVHNHVIPRAKQGADGFRFWLDDDPSQQGRIEPCDCGWAPEHKQHYRVVRNVRDGK
jgi:hypothetical protein